MLVLYMQETWVRWEPISGLVERYHMRRIVEDENGFTIELCDYERRAGVRFIFDTSVHAYRNTTESFRHKTVVEQHAQNDKSSLGNWSFFTVHHSAYVQWILEESAGIAQGLPLRHFVFVTWNTILDVVTNYEPSVERIEKL